MARSPARHPGIPQDAALRGELTLWDASDPARIDPACEIRTISFENPRGERAAAGTAAGTGWYEFARGPLDAFAICERQDDYCATAFVYCRDAQPVPRLDLASATADLARLPYEQPSPFEIALGVFSS